MIPWEEIHSLALAAVLRMNGAEIVLALLILAAAAVVLVLAPSPIHNRLQTLLGHPAPEPRRRTRARKP